MAAIALKTGPDVEVLPYGIYMARLREIVVENKQPDQYHDKPYQQLRWGWDVKVPGRKDTVSIPSWTSLSMHAKSNLPGLLRALAVYQEGMESVDPDHCVGKVCQLLVELNDATDPKLVRNKIKTYMPKPPKGGAPAANPAVAMAMEAIEKNAPVIPIPDEEEFPEPPAEEVF